MSCFFLRRFTLGHPVRPRTLLRGYESRLCVLSRGMHLRRGPQWHPHLGSRSSQRAAVQRRAGRPRCLSSLQALSKEHAPARKKSRPPVQRQQPEEHQSRPADPKQSAHRHKLASMHQQAETKQAPSPGRRPMWPVSLKAAIPWRRYLASNRHRKWTFLGAVAALNAAVFVAWRSARGGEPKRNGQPSDRKPKPELLAWLEANFIFSAAHMQAQRYWTLVTATFSHKEPMHCAVNLLTMIAGYGSILCAVPTVRSAHLAVLLLASAVCSSAVSLVDEYSRYKGKRVCYLGASGVVSAYGALAACVAPKTRMLLFAVVPVPIWALVPGFAIIDGMLLDHSDRVAHSSHLAGAACGLIYYLLNRRAFQLPGSLFYSRR